MFIYLFIYFTCLICSVFCYIWAIGGNLVSKDWDAFDTFIRGQFEENADAKVRILYLKHRYSF